jgi:tetratricopeptide (TPR) repeat protein
MSSSNKETEFNIAEQFNKTERYIEDNKKSLGIIGGAVLLIVLGYFAYIKFILGPAEIEAQGQMFMAERYFEQDSLQDAIDNLNAYDGEDDITPVLAIGATGDAYMEMGKTDEAIKYYQKAAGEKKNNFTSPIFLMKAGWAFESLGKYNDALQSYEQVKKDYPNTPEGADIGKYIARAKALSK